MMKFKEAVKKAFTHYVDFEGRARRSEYWYFVLFDLLVSLVLSVIARTVTMFTGTELNLQSVVMTIWSLAIFLPFLSVKVRRLHDIGKSGWWILLECIPVVGGIVVFIFECINSQDGDNKYGANPKTANA